MTLVLYSSFCISEIADSVTIVLSWMLLLSGAQTVVQPGAQVLAEGGPIVIGEGNLIQEQVTIINT